MLGMVKMIYRIKSAINANTLMTYYFVQRKENKWWKFRWETVCIQRLGNLSILVFPTQEKAQAWIDKRKI